MNAQGSQITKNDKKIAEQLDENRSGQVNNEIRLSTGVILEAKPANPSILIRVMTAVPRPNPPLYYDEGMGREMENPNDPDYIKRVKEHDAQFANAIMNVLIGEGTKLKSKPKGLQGPDDDKWLLDYKAYGLPTMPNSPAWRYIAWVMTVAAPNSADITKITDKVKALSGVKEADVSAAETFPASDSP